MRVICTYCSASKDPSPGLIPAFRRYLSPRIYRVREIARREAARFLILSGKFGLVEWDEPLPWYDHLLKQDEVGQLAGRIARQIAEKGVAEVAYYTASPTVDPNVAPYAEAVEQACRIAGIALHNVVLAERSLGSISADDWKEIMELAAEAAQLMALDRANGEAQFGRLLSYFPKDGMVFFQRGRAYEALGEAALARSDYEEAERRFPLERWQREARKALDRLGQSQGSGGTLAEARYRLAALDRVSEKFREDALAAIKKAETDPRDAAASLRRLLEAVVADLAGRQPARGKRDLVDSINDLVERRVAPELVANHMHTVRIIGNKAVHALADGPAIQIGDVYPTITSTIAILEWLNTQRSAR